MQAIESIKPGDRVWSWDEASDCMTLSEVTAVNRTGSFDARPGAQQPLSHAYDHDGLDRLTLATRGVWNGSLSTPSVTHSLNSQNWSLDALGNWAETSIETGTNGTFDSGELDDREHHFGSDPNRVNQLYKRNTAASAGGGGLDLAYDHAGNMRVQELYDDGPFGATGLQGIRYTHDAWNRLVKAEWFFGTTHYPRAEYEYNGLGWRVVKRSDSNLSDGTYALKEQRSMFYDGAWRLAHEYVDDDLTTGSTITSHVQYVWGSRYIDDIVLQRVNSNLANDTPTITYEAKHFHLTDAQFSTMALIDENANQRERVTYSAYGVARHQHNMDVDGDGDCDAADEAVVNGLVSTGIHQSGYRSECDFDRDGDIDSTDYGAMFAGARPATVWPGGLSNVGNQIGWDGYVFNTEIGHYHVRHRWYDPGLGRWIERDPAGYVDGMNLSEYAKSNSITNVDALGLRITGYENCTAAQQQFIHQADVHVHGITGSVVFQLREWWTSKKIFDWIKAQGRSHGNAAMDDKGIALYNRFRALAIKRFESIRAYMEQGYVATCCDPHDFCDSDTLKKPGSSILAYTVEGERKVHFCPSKKTATGLKARQHWGSNQLNETLLHELTHSSLKTLDLNIFPPPMGRKVPDFAVRAEYYLSDAYFYEKFETGNYSTFGVIDRYLLDAWWPQKPKPAGG